MDFILWPWFEMLEVMGEVAPEVVPTRTYLPALYTWVAAMKTLPAVKSQVTSCGSVVTRRADNPRVMGSTRAMATFFTLWKRDGFLFPHLT